jgi:4-hydroxy-tetrahydrodipicolinate reductase
LKIALIGYGKMGKAIETLALEAGHTIVGKYTSQPFSAEDLKKADVAIEFTNPHVAVDNIKKCFEAGVPVVVGSTGWYSDFEEIKELSEKSKVSLFYATNFSLGVNIFFELNKTLARLMNPQKVYEPKMLEIHHLQKKDAPSGTAITLAEGILENLDRKKSWVHRESQNIAEIDAFALQIDSLREGEVPGTHTITYTSQVDEIIITHQAFNRTGFASGALKAAEWLVDKKGIFTMKDLLGYTN